MNEPDFYAVLGVDPDADPQTIRAAYRRAAREHHPDRGGSAQKFHQVQSAWDVLGSPDARAAYDRRRRTPGSARSADSPAPTEEGAGFTYTRSAAQKSSAQHAAETRTRRRGETRSASADQPPVYEPPLATPEPLNLTLTSQKIHGGFVSRGLFSGRGRHRRLRTAALLEKHVLSALPAARLFNDVALTAAGTGRRGRDRTPKSAVRVDHVLLCGPTVILVSSHEVPAGAASWDGHALRAAGKSITLPDLAAQAKQLRISLAEQLREEHGVTGSLETDWQHILLAADDGPFHPVVQAQGAGRRGPAPLAAGRAIGHLVNVLASSEKANLVDRRLMAALRSRLAAPEDG